MKQRTVEEIGWTTMNSSKSAVRFENVDVVFGARAPEAISLLDKGEGRDAILDKTGCLIAVHDASVFVNEGEILVLMGLVGLRQVVAVALHQRPQQGQPRQGAGA